MDKNNAKALFRRGQAELELKNYDEALDDLARALSLSPHNQQIVHEYNRAKQLKVDYCQKQKIVFQKLFK